MFFICFSFVTDLLMVLAGEELGGRGWCTLLCAKVLLPGTTVEVEEALSVLVVVVVVVRAWPNWPSTGFLERWRPLFMCRSQYF